MCYAQLSENDTILCDLSYFILCDLSEPHGARGDVYARNLSTVSGDRLFRKPYQSMTYSYSRPLFTCSDLCAVHLKKCNHGRNEEPFDHTL
jgi:hypothetical protein